MNKRTVALTTEQYKEIIQTTKNGFTGCRPNERVALALMLEGNLGIRVSDVVKLRLSDIVQDGERYRLSITEQKTGKARTFTVPLALYQFLRIYCIDHQISPDAVIVPLTTTEIQTHLRKVCDYLGYVVRNGDIPGEQLQHRPSPAPSTTQLRRRHTTLYRHPATGSGTGH